MRANCSKAASGAAGLVPTSFSMSEYSVASPTNPAPTAEPTGELLTVTATGAETAGADARAFAAALSAATNATPPAHRAGINLVAATRVHP